MQRLSVALAFGPAGGTRPLGILISDGPEIYFSYEPDFLADPRDVSPFMLPCDPQLYQNNDPAFDRLPGLFFDALPDGWGRLLQDRAFGKLGVRREDIAPLDRLAAVGNDGIGALVFSPVRDLAPDAEPSAAPRALEELAGNASRIYEGSEEDILPELLAGGGSPGGARPKLLVGVRFNKRGEADIRSGEPSRADAVSNHPAGYQPWIIKFPARSDSSEAGPLEMAYSIMARHAGIDMPDTRLFTANGRRYFGIARFDRHGLGYTERSHMHTLGGLVHANYRQPSLDYEGYLTVSYQLMGGSMPAVFDAFRRMVFNVLSHNRDDHVRNFAFLMSADGQWRHSPAYDLTFSEGPNGEHTTSIGGEGRSPTLKDIYAVADAAGLPRAEAGTVVEQVNESIAAWTDHARSVELPLRDLRSMADRLDRIRTEVTRAGNR